MIERVVVATDGTPSAWGAVQFAAALARAKDVEIRVLAVLEPLVPPGNALQGRLPHAGELERAREHDLRTRALRQLASVPGAGAWPLELRWGWVASAVADFARAVDAELIVIGRGCRRPGERGLPLAVDVLGLARLPVLAAAPELDGLPRSAAVAVDFGATGARAARDTLELLARPARLRLIHAAPRFDFPAALVWGWKERYRQQAPAELDRLAATLEAGPEVELTTEVAEGDPAGVLLARAGRRGVDLLVAAGHGYPCRQRVLPGGAARALLRRADCSVLLVPPEAAPADEADETLAAHAVPA